MFAPQTPIPFGEQLFVLANITHIRDYRRTVSPSRTSEHERHLRLLNNMALLLVTQGSSDVAAVMFEQTSHEIIFYYAKNRPSTRHEREYIESLRVIALSLSDINDCTVKLLARVIPMCRSKIITRLKKLIRCLSESPVVSEASAPISWSGCHTFSAVASPQHIFSAPISLRCGVRSRRNVLTRSSGDSSGLLPSSAATSSLRKSSPTTRQSDG